MNTILLILLTFTICSVSLFADEVYDGKIILKGKKYIEAINIQITCDEIYFNRIGSTIVDSISTSDVRFLKVNDGNYLPYGLVIGASVGYGIYYGITPSIYLDTEESIIFAVAGLVLGGVVGGLTTKTTTLKLYNSFYMDLTMKNMNLPLTNEPYYQILNFSLNL